MPISGLKVGDLVLTPGGREATVKRVKRVAGRERVLVAYYGTMIADRWFHTAALRLRGRETELFTVTTGVRGAHRVTVRHFDTYEDALARAERWAASNSVGSYFALIHEGERLVRSFNN